MNVVPLRTATTTPIEQFDSLRAVGARLAEGSGEAHVHLIRFEPDGVIGAHEAGFGQLLVFLDGDGWIAGEDGQRRTVRVGELAFVARGEAHSKGSDTGATALMVQVHDLQTTPATDRP